MSFTDPTGFYFTGCDSVPECFPVYAQRLTIGTGISVENAQALIQQIFYSDFGTITVAGVDTSLSAHDIALANRFAAAQDRCGPSCTVLPGQHVAKAIGKYNAAISAAKATTLGKFEGGVEFQQELRGTISDVAFKLAIANDRNHLIFDPADAGKPLGSVIKRTGFLERLFTGRKFRHSYPNRLVPVGLEVSSGFAGAQRDIRNAVGVVIGYPRVYPGVLNANLLLSNQRLADYIGATVYAFTTRGGFNGPFAINPGQ